MLKILKYIKNSHLFYWYTGEKKIAIMGVTFALLVNAIILYYTFGNYTLVYFLFLLIMDHMIILCLLFYMLIRDYIPIAIIRSNIDEISLDIFLVMLLSWVMLRVIVNLTAEKIYKYEL